MIKHGTWYAYGHHKCRCDECKAYKRKENALYRGRTSAVKRPPKPGALREVGDKLYVYKHGRWVPSIRTICANCDKKMVVNKFQGGHIAGVLPGRYCSSRCINIARWAGGRKVVIKCVVCKRIRMVKRSKRDAYKTCGRESCQRFLRRRTAVRRHAVNGFAKKV